MARICCPHCHKRFSVNHSAFVTEKCPKAGTLISQKQYHPNPDRTYVTPEKMRRTSLTYYYRNRAVVLARAKSKRDAVKRLLAVKG